MSVNNHHATFNKARYNGFSPLRGQWEYAEHREDSRGAIRRNRQKARNVLRACVSRIHNKPFFLKIGTTFYPVTDRAAIANLLTDAYNAHGPTSFIWSVMRRIKKWNVRMDRSSYITIAQKRALEKIAGRDLDKETQ